MKLALLIPGFQSGPDDWCIPAFTNLVRELARTHEVHVFALRYPARKDTYRIGDVAVHAIGGGAVAGHRVTGLSLVGLWVQTLTTVRTEHSQSHFDAVMGIWATESGWLAANIAGFLGLPSVVHLAGGELAWLPEIAYGNAGGGLASLLVGSCVRKATLLTVPSLPVLQLAKRRGIPEANLRTWPLGVDTSMFSPGGAVDGTAARPFVFATAGSLIPVKDHQWLIRAFALLREKCPNVEVRLNIAGDGPLRPRLERLVQELHLEGYVDFAGDLSHDRLPDFYHSSDCFVLTSQYEAQCMAALEAMACGVPWIGPTVGALCDLSRGQSDANRSGFTVPQRMDDALAEAMKAVLDLPAETKAAMGAEARSAVLERYALDSQVGELSDMLQRLTAKSAVATITRAYQ